MRRLLSALCFFFCFSLSLSPASVIASPLSLVNGGIVDCDNICRPEVLLPRVRQHCKIAADIAEQKLVLSGCR